MMMNFATNYWNVGESSTVVYSGASNSYVSQQDPAYVAWLAAGHLPSRILNEAELWAVLTAVRPDALPSWLFDGTTFVPPSATTYSTAQLVAYAASKRYDTENGGLTFSGIPVATDDRSKQMIMGARIAASSDPNFTTQWVGADGNVYVLNATQLIAISNAVLAHVSTCFSVYATVKSNIVGATVTTLAQIDAAFAAITT